MFSSESSKIMPRGDWIIRTRQFHHNIHLLLKDDWIIRKMNVFINQNVLTESFHQKSFYQIVFHWDVFMINILIETFSSQSFFLRNVLSDVSF